MRKSQALSIVAAGFFLVSAAFAQEKPVTLKDGPGLPAVQNFCSGCHSLDYIRINAPFMNRMTWTAEVNKMVNVFAAPIPQSDAAVIVEYLAANYGAPG
jgi:sulfite dehydrogenase (cytochrome) subunit B